MKYADLSDDQISACYRLIGAIEGQMRRATDDQEAWEALELVNLEIMNEMKAARTSREDLQKEPGAETGGATSGERRHPRRHPRFQLRLSISVRFRICRIANGHHQTVNGD